MNIREIIDLKPIGVGKSVARASLDEQIEFFRSYVLNLSIGLKTDGRLESYMKDLAFGLSKAPGKPGNIISQLGKYLNETKTE